MTKNEMKVWAGFLHKCKFCPKQIWKEYDICTDCQKSNWQERLEASETTKETNEDSFKDERWTD